TLDHPALPANLEILRARGVRIVEAGAGYLACGWLGKGRLAEVPEIVAAAMAVLERRRDLAGETVLVTAGPTVEDIDPVRFLSNRSSGRMGYRVAEAARDRGARVVLVSGPTALPGPSGIERVAVRSAEEVARAVADRVGEAGVGVGGEAAALRARGGGAGEVPLGSKRALADAIWDRVIALRKSAPVASAARR